ncbi:aryl-sulfate sulfotransferase [candidate division KSB1 bacterium]|nr:aryl-sulfate sulfotransferase [candidate division KSB1 bacterium]
MTRHSILFLLLSFFIFISGSQSGQIRTINGVTVPSDFPDIQTFQYGETAPGKIFFGSTFGDLGNYLVILENDGTPAFYRRFPSHSNGSGEFRVQPGNLLIAFFYQQRYYIVFDQHYNQIDTLQCSSNYLTDAHELLITPNGHRFFICLDPQTVDMSQIVTGGHPSATVLGNHVQEQDAYGNVVFEWQSWDHFDISDAVHENLHSSNIDYVHMNSIAVDFDDHIIISSRHLDEVTKINHDTGEIIWRLGGRHNQFDFINDPYEISYQHHARPVEGHPNHYTVFDNGNHRSPSFARAVEYQLDTVAMTAEKVWEFRYDPDIQSGMMGNAQRLPNGNTFINWADWPPSFACEVNPEGDVLFEMDLEISSNRIRRYEWEGMMEAPYLMAEPQSAGVVLIFNKFGDPDVDVYRVYGDTISSPTTLLAETDETHLYLTGLDNSEAWYFTVTAVDPVGIESSGSNEVRVETRFLQPGENIILNGDFSQGDQNWTLLQPGSAIAWGTIDNQGQYRIQISEGSDLMSNVQLRQTSVGLVLGKQYRFEFDAYADADRTVEAILINENPPNTNYGQISPSFLRPFIQHFTYDFEMMDPMDLNTTLVFNCGATDGNVFVDNVSLMEISNAVPDHEVQPETWSLNQNYPNPFNASTRIKFSIPKDEQVNLSLYNIKGQRVTILLDEFKSKGSHLVNVDGTSLSAGLYFYKLQTSAFTDIRKMILLK